MAGRRSKPTESRDDKLIAALARGSGPSGVLLLGPSTEGWNAYGGPALDLPLPHAAGDVDRDLAREVLLACIGGEPAPGIATSVRIPASVHGAAHAAIGEKWAASISELVVEGLRARLAAMAMNVLGTEAVTEIREALEAHYVTFPDARPPLAMIVQSAAELEGHPAAGRTDLIRAAIADLGDDAFVEDVLSWVRGAIASESAARSSQRKVG